MSRSGPSLIPPDVLLKRPRLARELAEHRIGLCLTQSQLAARAGIHPGSLQQYETGYLVPSDATYAKLRKALGWAD